MSNKRKISPQELAPEERANLIDATQITHVNHAPQRLIKELVKVYPRPLPTLDVNKICAIGNISHVAVKVNQRIFKHGFFIACEKPLIPFKNRFGHASQMHLWGLHKLPEATYDPFYDPAGE